MIPGWSTFDSTVLTITIAAIGWGIFGVLDGIEDYFKAKAEHLNTKTELLEFDVEILEADRDFEQEQLDQKQINIDRALEVLEDMKEDLEALLIFGEQQAKEKEAKVPEKQPATDGCTFHSSPEVDIAPGLTETQAEVTDADNPVPASENGSGQQSASS